MNNWTLKIDSPIFSIKGIGFISALSLIAEYGNFMSFDYPAQMLSFAGLEPSIIQSGTSYKEGHMVKRGSGYLRDTLMNVAIPFMMHNPVIYDYYLKKKNEGNPNRVALSRVAKKLIRIIFYLVKSNQPFSKWGEVFGDNIIATAIIDCLVHHSSIIKITGKSYRIKDKLQYMDSSSKPQQ